MHWLNAHDTSADRVHKLFIDVQALGSVKVNVWEEAPMRDKREATVGVATVKMQPAKGVIKGVVIVDGAIKVQDEGDDADEVWRRLQDAAARLNPKFFGFDGARNRFLRFFPDGFNSSDYARRERDYKTKAKHRTVRLEIVAAQLPPNAHFGSNGFLI
jgi:hypothetical protein